jgi:hypothetical protein
MILKFTLYFTYGMPLNRCKCKHKISFNSSLQILDYQYHHKQYETYLSHKYTISKWTREH